MVCLQQAEGTAHAFRQQAPPSEKRPNHAPVRLLLRLRYLSVSGMDHFPKGRLLSYGGNEPGNVDESNPARARQRIAYSSGRTS